MSVTIPVERCPHGLDITINDCTACELEKIQEWVVELTSSYNIVVGRLEEIKSIHREHGPSGNGIHICIEDKESWPCRTISIITDGAYFTRQSKCYMCGKTKSSDPTSKMFLARPHEEFDSDWDGCSQGMGT